MSEQIKKKNRKTWAAEDEILLVELWADKQADLIGQRKNSHIFKEMAEIMVGYTPEEIKVKVHNLTNRYRKEKKLVGPSGGSPSQWGLYFQIHAILGERPMSNLEKLQEDSLMESMYSTQEPSSQEPLSDTLSPSSTAVVPSASSSAAASTAPAALSSPDAPSNSTAGKKRKRVQRDEEFHKQDEIIMENFKLIKETDEKLISIEDKRNEILERIAKSCELLQQEVAIASQRSFFD